MAAVLVTVSNPFLPARHAAALLLAAAGRVRVLELISSVQRPILKRRRVRYSQVGPLLYNGSRSQVNAAMTTKGDVVAIKLYKKSALSTTDLQKVGEKLLPYGPCSRKTGRFARSGHA